VNTEMKRTLAIATFAVVFGVLVAVLKGGDAGLRDSLGNVSAPWLLLPYFAGTGSRGLLRGAALGLSACLAALLGFYVAESVVLDLGPHPWLTDLALTLSAGRIYFTAALISGPVMGAIGGAFERRTLVSAVVVGLTLMGEPLVVFLYQASHGIDPGESGMVIGYPVLWIGEVVLGFVLSAAMLARRSRSTAVITGTVRR